MRADRLLSILLLLQAHGRMSAAELARRVEVSRRTVFRDLEALSGAGIPVVSDRGPNGGAYLLGGYRTDLTGLTESELEALLAFGGQGPAADLGLGPQLDRASRKVAAAARRESAGRLRARVLIDSERWYQTARVPRHPDRSRALSGTRSWSDLVTASSSSTFPRTRRRSAFSRPLAGRWRCSSRMLSGGASAKSAANCRASMPFR